jgi:hypothetical protein
MKMGINEVLMRCSTWNLEWSLAANDARIWVAVGDRHWSRCTKEELSDAGLLCGFLAAKHTSEQYSMLRRTGYAKGM